LFLLPIAIGIETVLGLLFFWVRFKFAVLAVAF